MKKLLAILFLIPAISFAETDYIATPILADIQNGADNANKINTLRVGGQSFLSGTVNFGSLPETNVGTGEIVGSATIAVTENGSGVIFKTTISCVEHPIDLTDVVDTVQWSGTQVYDFPEGMLLILGAVIDGVVNGPDSMDADFDGDIGLGTVRAAGDATLTSTEQDILATTPMTIAAARVAICDAQSVATLLTESGARWFDGTVTAKDLYLNILVDDDDDHDSDDGTFTGTIEITWINLGDN